MVGRRLLRLVLTAPGGPLGRVVAEDPHGSHIGQHDGQGDPDGQQPTHFFAMLGSDIPGDLSIAEGRQPRRRIFLCLADVDVPSIRWALDHERDLDHLADDHTARDPGVRRPTEQEKVAELARAGVEQLPPRPDVRLRQPRLDLGRGRGLGGGRVYEAPRAEAGLGELEPVPAPDRLRPMYRL